MSKKNHFGYLVPFCIVAFILFSLEPDILPQSKDKNTDWSELKFKLLSTKDGLSQNYVTAMAQDSMGFMWFGSSSGLQKYDGYTFTRYTYNPFDTTTLSGDAVRGIFADSRGLLWINIEGRKCNIMDLKTEQVLREAFTTNSNLGIITEDKKENIWITGGDASSFPITGRLFKISQQSIANSDYKLVQYHYHPANPQILAILPDENGILWLGTTDGLVKLRPDSERTPQYYYFKDLEKNVKYLPGAINAIEEENDSTLWLGLKSGLVLFNKETGGTILYRHGEKNRIDITGIVHDLNGMIWTNKYIFKKNNSTYQRFQIKNFPETGARVFRDRAGNIWIGSGYGLYTYFPESNRFRKFALSQKTPENHLSVRAFLEDSRENLWFSTWNYIYKWDRTTNELSAFGDMYNLKLFGSTGASAIAEDRNEIIWFVSAGGLTSYDLRSNRKAYHLSGFPDMAVHGVFADREGEIWFVTGRNLRKLTDAEGGHYISYRFDEKPPQYGESWHAAIYQDKAGNIWFTTKTGLIKFNHQSKKFIIYNNDPTDRRSISRNWTSCICPDPLEPSEKLWIGTNGGGLNLFNKHTETFTHISEKDGLPDNVVYGILSDNNGNLWLSTNRGISKYNPISKQFINYDANDGLQSDEFNTGAYFKSKSGEMFFGGINGFNYFYPDQVANKNVNTNIVFTNFKIFSKSISARDSNSVLTRVISETKEITIPYNENIFSFEFASLDYYAPAKNKFAYKLEGFSDDWIRLGTKRDVTFTGLNPGEYTLKVKGTNSDGIWSNKVASLKIIITTPFWETWWAYSLYGLFALGMLYGLRRYELNRSNLKNQVKLDEVKLKEREETDRIKSRFFTNISHEFRTPLTLILGQIDSIMSSDIEVKEKGKLQVANRNARRLLTLINQLLDISKIESGNMELDAEPHNIVSFLKSLFYSFESLAESKKIKLSFQSGVENLPVIFDPDKMEKVFYNLLSNAFKFTPANGEIKVVVNELKDSIVEIIIKDTGIGIPADRLPNIFDRFYQVDGSQTREHEGTGVGLALVKELIELHEGKISINSKEGEGSEFIVQLPKGKFDPEREQLVELPNNNSLSMFINDNPENADEGTNNTGSANIGKRSNNSEMILIVEDNSDVRAYISEQLKGEYEVIESINGEEGFIKAQREIPDLIITDVMMPKMNGYQLSYKIRSDEKTSHIPIIMLTAKASFNDKIEGLETGIDAYLIKPFSLKELRVRIKNLIDQRKQLRKRFSQSTIIKPSEVSAVSSDQIFLKKTLAVIEKHFEDEHFSVEILADMVNMSPSQLNRKLNALIDQPAGKLINSFRLQRAADLLKKNTGNVAEICFRVGYNDQSYFARAFKKQFGLSPTAYKKSGN